MEVSHQDILLRMRSTLIEDLDVENIKQCLVSQCILNEDELKDICSAKTKKEKAERLLNVLPNCGEYAFGVFHQSLKHHYEWLSDEIDKLLNNYEIKTNGEIDYYAGPPNIPPLSPLTVTRKEKVKQLKRALQELDPSEYVVLHGMKGFGKSCLAASTLKDIKLMKNNKVYWIKFACDRPLDEEILVQLNTLYHNVQNLEIQPESFTILEKDALICFFQCHFNKEDNRHALLILDDVLDKKIIDTFDFECKTLVLTTDIDVLDERRAKTVIKMNDGFTESETLGLFAKVLEMDVSELPNEAKKIHEECKGMPLLIAMFAAQFEEFKHDMKIRTDRWRYYLDCLRKKDATNRVMKKFFEKQETIFDMFIEQLTPDLKKHYMTIAVFGEDVNITAKTLEIFWEKNIFHVEELMQDLCHKSLAAKKWNKDLKTYVYGVHDLLLCHLRKKLTPNELTQMHKTLIEKYSIYCMNDFSKLPDDNYIYSYIGHHMEQAELTSIFPNFYLNFDFIQAKIMHAGLNDLLLDLRKYKKYITLYGEEDEAKVFDLQIFLQEQASLILQHRHKRCLDIIQIAMKHPYQGYVKQTAKALALGRQDYLYLYPDLYLDIEHVINLMHMPLTEEISTDICTSSFTDDPNLILSGNTSGKVILWNCESKQQKVFNGHSKDCFIKKILLSMKGDCFLSLGSNGIIKLFPLSDNERFDHIHMQVGSPRQKQSFWSGIIGNVHDQDDSLREFSVKNEIILDMVFGHEDKVIAACTNRGTIQMWNPDGNPILTLGKLENESITTFTKITFTAEDKLLLNMDESTGAFYLYTNIVEEKNRKKVISYQYMSCYNLQSRKEKVIFFECIPKKDNALIIVTEKQAMQVIWWFAEKYVHSFSKQIRASIEDDSVTYTCATRTHDNEYLVVADSAGFVNVWSTYNEYQPIAIYRSHVTSLDSYWLKEEGYHIICGNENKSLYRWNFPIKSKNSPRNYLFDAVIKSHDEQDIIIKQNHPKKLLALNGKEIEAESPYSEETIISLQLSSNGKEVVYVTEKNTVMWFNIETGETTLVLQLDQPIKFVKIINIDNSNLIVCAWMDTLFQVWRPNPTLICKIKSNGCIAHVHKLNDDYVITITQNTITFWRIGLPWKPFNEKYIFNPELDAKQQTNKSDISFTCLSHDKKYLAILKKFNLIIYSIYERDQKKYDDLEKFEACQYYMHSFPEASQKAIYCDISENELYIAIGFQTGLISIIDIQKKMEITKLSFHNNPIAQLSWAPNTLNVPILFSLTNYEMAWWNIALVKNTKRRSRKGISHSTSTPSFGNTTSLNLQIPNSQSVDTGVANLQDNEELTAVGSVTDVARYWARKTGKYPEISELLNVVELPPSLNVKVCISPDFSKFVMIDIYGFTRTFKLIN